MFKKVLMKKIAACLLAAGVIISGIPATDYNVVYADVNVSGSQVISVDEKIHVVTDASANEGSTLYKFIPTSTDTYALYSEGEQSVYCKILDSNGNSLTNFYPTDENSTNFCTNYEFKQGVTYYFQIASEDKQALDIHITLKKYNDVSLNIEYTGDSESNHVKIPVILNQPATVSINAVVTTSMGSVTYSWYAYDKTTNLTYLQNETGDTLSISEVTEATPAGYRCIVSNGIVSEMFEIELLTNIDVSDLENTNETIYLNDSKKVSFEGNVQGKMVYKFVPNETEKYVIYGSDETENSPVTRAELYDESGKYIDYNENGNGTQFVLTNTLEAGSTYYYVITRKDENNNPFRITLKKASDIKLKITYDQESYDIINQLYKVECKEGDNVEMGFGAIVASDVGEISYKWFNGNYIIAGQTRETLTIANVGIEDGGTYYCQVTNGLDTKRFKVLLTVSPKENETQPTTQETEATTQEPINEPSENPQPTANNQPTANVNQNRDVNQKTVDTPTKKTVTVGRAKIKSAKKKAGKAKVSVKLKKVSGVAGYEVQVSTSKKFAKKTTKVVTGKNFLIQ